MRKKILGFICLAVLFSFGFGNDINSLSDVFAPGKGLLDKDGDGFPDHVGLCLIIPENASPYEITSASDIAARANLESLVVNMDILSRDASAVLNSEESASPVIISCDLSWIKKTVPGLHELPDELPSHQGLVCVSPSKHGKIIMVTAGSKDTLLKTSRAFFLRWPYLWDIWGREQGVTYLSVEEDIKAYLKSRHITIPEVNIISALYEFPDKESSFETINRLQFNRDQIKILTIDLVFENTNDRNEASEALQDLALNHKRGLETEVLSYPGCAELNLRIKSQKDSRALKVPRVGYPKRILTPSYKSPVKTKVKENDFDLIDMLSLSGIYSDKNQDKIPDDINTSLIVPEKGSLREIASLSSRLTLHTAGASFPLTYLDSEIEKPEELPNPIIIGKDNSLYKELVKTGKLIEAELKPGTAAAYRVTQAFNKSNAVVLSESDDNSLAGLIDYLSRVYPYFDAYEPGRLKLQDIPPALEEFLDGKRGSTEGYFLYKLKNTAKKLSHKKIKTVSVDLCLPEKNKNYEDYIHKYLENALAAEEINVKSFSFDDSQTVFQMEKTFDWEVDDVFRRLEKFINSSQWSGNPLNISIGVSESPEIREKIKKTIKELLEKNEINDFRIDVMSSYKQGFFWLKEKVIPSLKSENTDHVVIQFSQFTDDLKQLKRFYADPYRWLQELYPIDDIISEETGIPLDKIIFEKKDEKGPAYVITAYDDKEKEIFTDHFSPRVTKTSYLNVLPEWGTVTRTTGWLQIKEKGEVILDVPIDSDLERFWDFYQAEVISSVHDYILKKTDNKPSFKKQPYFKRLLIEIWLSEPDYRLGLDQEIISSLEAIHDEIYFDTLDFLRGITDIQTEETDLPEDSSRYSAPGNVLPLIHPSTEGKKPKVSILFEDRRARSPFMTVNWSDDAGNTSKERIEFDPVEMKKLSTSVLVYDSEKKRIHDLTIEAEIEKEQHYLDLIEIIDSFRELYNQETIPSPFHFPGLNQFTLKIKHKDIFKEETFPVSYDDSEDRTAKENEAADHDIVPTQEIISPQMCLDIVDRLSGFEAIHSYIGGKSYEGKKVPVIEIHSPTDQYTSLQRLITFKPTLYCNGRQHANEVCSTNYILKFAELVAKNDEYRSFLKKINFVFHPMENPDGAELAYRLQKLTPFHSLHAGRYSTLGIDIGHQVNADHPILPEAKVRKNLYNRWLPDIHLNLHGYPSHEWVQPFSDYTPFLFRDYWIPRGWFVYYRTVSLPIYEKWKRAGEELKKHIIEELHSPENIRLSNKSLYDRYYRWAARWHPHMNNLEIQGGVNIYSKRQSSTESKLTERRKITFAEETPELMDETAQGEWLGFLVEQGLAYIKAHALYLSESTYQVSRIEEEIKNKICIQFIRSRPGEPEK
mgnify:CR=1 FL=1